MNIANETLRNYGYYITRSERRFLTDIAFYRRLTPAQDDVARVIRARARRRYVRGW